MKNDVTNDDDTGMIDDDEQLASSSRSVSSQYSQQAPRVFFETSAESDDDEHAHAPTSLPPPPRKESKPINIIADGESEATPQSRIARHDPPEPPMISSSRRRPVPAVSFIGHRAGTRVSATASSKPRQSSTPQRQPQQRDEDGDDAAVTTSYEKNEKTLPPPPPAQSTRTKLSASSASTSTPVPTKTTLPQFAPPEPKHNIRPRLTNAAANTTPNSHIVSSASVPAPERTATRPSSHSRTSLAKAPTTTHDEAPKRRSFYVPLERQLASEERVGASTEQEGGGGEAEAFQQEQPQQQVEDNEASTATSEVDFDIQMLIWMDQVISDVPNEWKECLTELRNYYYLSVERLGELLKFMVILDISAHLYNDKDRQFVQNKYERISDVKNDASAVFNSLYNAITDAIIPLRTLITERQMSLEEADLQSKVFEHTDMHEYFINEQKEIANKYVDVLEVYQIQMRDDIDRVRSKFAALQYNPGSRNK